MPLSFPDSDAGDEFSNNLFSDLAPLLALFGEDVAKQFMTASMGWADNIIFAMAPIGVITAIVSAIRIGGSTWLKGLIGRVKENTACAEEQLTSSTSNEVCEMFNGSHVVRLMGAPAIKELIYIRPKEVTAQDNPRRQIQASPSCAGSTVTQNSDIAKIENKYNVWTLQDAEKMGDMVKEQGSSFLQEIWQLRPKTSGPSIDQRPAPPPPHDLEHQAAGPEELPDKQDPEKESPQPKDGVSDDTINDGPPNISINMRGRVRQKELYIVAAIGVILQVAVLVFDWFITYHPGFKQRKGGKDMAPYAFPITSTGTVTLVVGMLVCCYIVESSTTDSSYMANSADLHMLWLQQGGVVSDQMFNSYVLLAREKRDVVTISRRVKSASGGGTGNSIFVRFLTAFGSAVSVIGFVLQFVGLRAMNWSASVAQFVATVIMIILRAYVRRGLSESPYSVRVPKGYEIDWLATRIATADDKDKLWRISPGAPSTPKWSVGWILRKLGIRLGEPSVDGKTDTFWEQGCFDWGIRTVESVGNGYKALKSGDEQINEEKLLRSMEVVKSRIHLGKTTGWYGTTMERAICVASAIEAVMNVFFPKDSQLESLVWSIYGHGDQEIKFNLRRDKNSPWVADIREIEAVLSLWLFSVAQKESETKTSKLQGGIEGRVSGTESRNHSLRLLAPMDEAVLGCLRWWLGSGMVLVKGVTIPDNCRANTGNPKDIFSALDITLQPPYEPTDGSAREQNIQFERHRIVGYIAEDTRSVLAVTSDAPLDIVYAQELFSAFMWAFARCPYVGSFGGLTTAKQSIDMDDPSSKALFESTTLDNTELSQLAKTISRSGLGTVEDIMFSIFPPLVVERKLPDMCAIVNHWREKGRAHESYRRWDSAGEVYINALKASHQFHGIRQKKAIYEAACALTEFIRQLTIEIEVTEQYREEKYGLSTSRAKVLGDLRGKMVEGLKKYMENSVLTELGHIYRKQNRQDGASEWKPRMDIRTTFFRRRFQIPMRPHYWTALHDAVVSGDQTRTKEELKNLSSPDPTDFAGLTPLHYATQCNIAKILLSSRAHVDATGHDGFTPLHSAARIGNKEIVELLIEHGASLNARDTNRRTPLHWAAQDGQNDVIEHLLKKGADPQPSAEHDRRPLHMAACGGHVRAVNKLLEIGQVDINMQDSDGRTALHLAVVGGYDNLVGTLAKRQQRGSSWVEDRSGWTAIHLAAFLGHDKVIKVFLTDELSNDEIAHRLQLKGSNGRTILQTAIESGRMLVVQCLLNRGADKEAEDENGNTALMNAAYFQHHDLVKYLLDQECEIKSRNSNDETPLHHAAYGNGEKGSLDAVRILLSHKAETDPKDKDERTPLLRASAHGESTIVEILLENGADINAKDQAGYTAIHLAAQNKSKETIKILLNKGADKEATDKEGDTVLMNAAFFQDLELVQYLLEEGCKIESQNFKGQTPLHYSAYGSGSGSPEAVKIFLLRHMEIDRRDNGGRTPLLWASENGEYKVVKTLLEEGADVHAKDHRSRTALHNCAEFGSKEGVEILLSWNADIGAKDDDGYTALHMATKKCHLPIIENLVKTKGLEIEAEGKDTRTALDIAVSVESIDSPLDIVKLLVNSGAVIRASTLDRKGTIELAVNEEPHQPSASLLLSLAQVSPYNSRYHHMSAILTSIQQQGPSKATYHIMLPPSYSDHDPLPPPSFDPLAMLFSHYPIVTEFAKLITTGDLIQLSRTSSTIREALLQSPSYWAKLMALTSLVCSESTHIKGDNVKNCVICSMPVCETCIVKSDFHGTSGTFSNRIRTFCDSCWSATDFSHPSNSPLSSAPPVCICVAKDGWLCSHCRSTERAELEDNKHICATDGCSSPHGASEKQRVCTWCRLPLPPAWRPVTELPIGSGAGGSGEEEEAPGYEEGSGKITEIIDSPVDKLRVARWNKMDERERADYQDAWLRKGARESERAGKVVRAKEVSGESSSTGAARGVEEVPSFEDAGDDELGESSGSAAQKPLDNVAQKPTESEEGSGGGEGSGHN